jgi:hypothetical protein
VDRKAWNSGCLERAASRGGNFLSALGSSRRGKERNSREIEGGGERERQGYYT